MPRIQTAIRIRWHIPIVAVAIYALVIFGGRRVMRDREPFDLRGALAVWNGLLAAFSIMGMIRTVPYLFYWCVYGCVCWWGLWGAGDRCTLVDTHDGRQTHQPTNPSIYLYKLHHTPNRLATIGFRALNCTIPSFTHGERDVGFWCVRVGDDG